MFDIIYVYKYIIIKYQLIVLFLNVAPNNKRN